MQVTVTNHGPNVAVVAMNGRLDLLSAADVKTKINEVVNAGRCNVVADLGAVSMVDSSGLGALIGGLKAARVAGGDLRLANPQEQAKLILRLTMLDRVLVAYANVEDALAAYA
jgi:anti-anti-sigma factor